MSQYLLCPITLCDMRIISECTEGGIYQGLHSSKATESNKISPFHFSQPWIRYKMVILLLQPVDRGRTSELCDLYVLTGHVVLNWDTSGKEISLYASYTCQIVIGFFCRQYMLKFLLCCTEVQCKLVGLAFSHFLYT